jgi:hypothetical protein
MNGESTAMMRLKSLERRRDSMFELIVTSRRTKNV